MNKRSRFLRDGATRSRIDRASGPQLALLTLTVVAAPCFAQSDALAERSRDREVSFTYQYFETEGLGTDIETLPSGKTEAHVVNFEFAYALNDKWLLTAGLPLVSKRYRGSAPHTPWTIIPPRTDSEFLDDGHYHTDFQDLNLGFRYVAKTDPVVIEPFVIVGAPSHDYAFFAQAAVGPNLRRVEVGVDLTYQPPFSNFFFNFSPSREFIEKTLGYDVDHWRLDVEVGYFVNPRIAVKTFVSGRDGDGLSAYDFTRRDNELWYQHDRIARHNYVNVGLGVDWTLDDRHRLSSAVLRMAHAQDVHVLKYAISVGVSRSF